MKESGEQHMSSKAVEEVIVDDDGHRWVREGATANWADGVPAPMDKHGNVVPLATRKLYDENGREVEVGEIALVDSKLYGRLDWRVRTHSGISLDLDLLYLERPDTWERLEADVERLANCYDVCDYFDATGRKAHDCGNEDGFCCDLCVARDILRRAKAIAVRGKGE